MFHNLYENEQPQNWKVYFIFLNISVPTYPLLVMTFPFCASIHTHHNFSTSVQARQLLSDPISWMWCTTNFISKTPSFDHISSSDISHPAGVKGHPLMSFEVVAEIKGVQESCMHSTQTHKYRYLTTLLADVHDLIPHFALVNQTWLSYSPSINPSLTHSFHPSGQPAPPREIPERCWNTLLHHVHKAIVG